MNNKPFFSVIIPTRNRAHLLPAAIQSVLNQTFGDFELIISDNFSSDNTKQVAAAFDDKRIKYFRSDKDLTMNDSWEFAISHAAGEYLAFLSDDDAHTPLFLEKARQVITDTGTQLVVSQMCYYYHENWKDHDTEIKANTLALFPYSGKVYPVSTRDALLKMGNSCYIINDQTAAGIKFICPFMINAVFHNSLFPRIKKLSKKIFAAVPGDIFVAAMTFGLTEQYFCIDEPLAVWSRWEGSFTKTNINESGNGRLTVPLMPDDEKLLVPLNFAVNSNAGANAILKAAKYLKPKFDDLPVDWSFYFIKTYEHLIFMEANGYKIDREIKELYKALSGQSKETREAAVKGINSFYMKTKRYARKYFPTLSNQIRKSVIIDTEKPIYLEGKRLGFENLEECTALFNHSFLDKYSFKY